MKNIMMMTQVRQKKHWEKITWKITEQDSEFYFIRFEGENVGGIRIARHHQGELFVDKVNWISPIFVIPAFQNKGIAGLVIQKIFELYSDTVTWRLATIKEEPGNCHFYEKCGFTKVGGRAGSQ